MQETERPLPALPTFGRRPSRSRCDCVKATKPNRPGARHAFIGTDTQKPKIGTGVKQAKAGRRVKEKHWCLLLLVGFHWNFQQWAIQQRQMFLLFPDPFKAKNLKKLGGKPQAKHSAVGDVEDCSTDPGKVETGTEPIV